MMSPAPRVGRHPTPLPPHGDVKRFYRGCRCAPCRAARATRRNALRRRGPQTMVPIAAVQAHLAKFRLLGHRQISRLSQVTPVLVRKIRLGHVTHIRAATVARLLALTTKVLADGALVSAWRTRKLVHALEVEGWSKDDIVQMLGLPARALRADRRMVRIKTARLVEALYQRLMGEAWDASTTTTRVPPA